MGQNTKDPLMDNPHRPKSRGTTYPKFYNRSIETWDYIAAHNLDFFEGNIIKYVTRHKSKNGLEDLEKARVYLDKLISITYKDYNYGLQDRK
jgi:hypothetical protein|tara:strand:+ start:641 stop:916 length:276 start_codon:yes stop_codon:yes gene_type:complete